MELSIESKLDSLYQRILNINSNVLGLTTNCEHIVMCRGMRKPDFCICKNKDADKLCSDCEADLHLCFCYTDSTISLQLNLNFQASSLLL